MSDQPKPLARKAIEDAAARLFLSDSGEDGYELILVDQLSTDCFCRRSRAEVVDILCRHLLPEGERHA